MLLAANCGTLSSLPEKAPPAVTHLPGARTRPGATAALFYSFAMHESSSGHIPVMPAEVLLSLEPHVGQVIVDGTLPSPTAAVSFTDTSTSSTVGADESSPCGEDGREFFTVTDVIDESIFDSRLNCFSVETTGSDR